MLIPPILNKSVHLFETNPVKLEKSPEKKQKKVKLSFIHKIDQKYF